MIKQVIFRIGRLRILQHLVFWIISFFILVRFFNTSNQVEKIDVIYTLIFHVSLLTGVYINLLVLIPHLLKKKKYLIYALLLIATIAGTSGFNLITFDKWIDYILPGYYFISFYDFPDILKFVVIYISLTTLLKLSKGWFMLMETNQKLMKIEQEKTKTELMALRSQINPHFLFNSLNSIYSLAMKGEKKTPGIILLLSDLMRYMLYETNDELVPLKKEVQYLENYIELQKLRSEQNANISFQIEGKVNDQKIAPLIFLPFVENSFKHGIKGDISGGYVNINFHISDRNVLLVLTNNKGTVDEVEKSELKGIGLANARRRLELLYPGKHELNIIDSDNEFKVELKLDLS